MPPLVLDGSGGVSGVDGTASNPAIEGTDSNTGIFYPAADTVAIGTGGTEALRVNSAQQVGVNTTSPTAPLDVVSNSAATSIKARGRSSDNIGVQLFTANNGSTNYGSILWKSDEVRFVNENAGYLSFYTSATERMRIDSAGNVGIGTTSPATRLDVSGSMQVTGSVSGYGGGEVRLGLTTSGLDNAISTQSTGAAIMIFDHRGTSNTGYWLWRNGTGGANERMRLDGSGNLGIATGASINAVLDVVQASASANGGRVAYFRSTAAGDVANNAVIISKFDNNTTTSQIFMKFEVNNTATSCGRINANGANTAAFGSTSDQRVKENIEDLPSQLQNILALRPVEFDYIESYGGGHQIGFIAQEMQEVYPDVVSADESEEQILSITGWSKTEARLVKAIQEQQVMIDEMKAEIAALKGNA